MKNSKNLKSKHFEQNLSFGARSEKLAVKLLKPDYPDVRRVVDEVGVFKDYDLLDDISTWEVKADTTSKQTGNIAIEFESYDKPSGIASTKADYWFQIYWCEGWVYTQCEVEKLKDILMLRAYPIVSGGEDMRSRMYLIPAIEFSQDFGCINI